MRKLVQLSTIVIFIGAIAFVYISEVFKNPSGSVEFSPLEFKEKEPAPTQNVKPKNIILFIADGMGFAHLSLALMNQEGEPNPWEKFTVKGWQDPRSSYGPLTDSGASGTAMATGTSTYFEVIGLDPDGNHLTSLLEVAQGHQYRTGIVTDSYVWDATPAAFVAHTMSRDNSKEIMEQLAASKLDLIFGELEDVGEDGNPGYEETMEIIRRRFTILGEDLSLPKQDSVLQPIAAIYDEDHVQNMNSSPNLLTLTSKALNYLSSDSHPFVLVVESEEMDAASHDNNSQRVIDGLQSIQNTLAAIMEFAETDGETLVLFTADHETGGLSLLSDATIYPNLHMKWASQEHTAAVVPVLAYGPSAEHFGTVHRNFEIGRLLKALINTGKLP